MNKFRKLLISLALVLGLGGAFAVTGASPAHAYNANDIYCVQLIESIATNPYYEGSANCFAKVSGSSYRLWGGTSGNVLLMDASVTKVGSGFGAMNAYGYTFQTLVNTYAVCDYTNYYGYLLTNNTAVCTNNATIAPIRNGFKYVSGVWAGPWIQVG